VTLRPGASPAPLGDGAEPLVAGSHTFVVRLGAGASLAGLRRLPGVVAIEPDRERRGTGHADPFIPQQTYLRQIAWTPSTGRRRPLVAVLDTGVDGKSRDLRDQVVTAFARSFIDGSPALTDRSGHGTHVAGIIAATAGNGIGMAGVANARLLIVKVADSQGRATTSTLVRGIRYAVARGARIVNLSFGGAGYSKLEQDTILEARREGDLVVAAAGNSGGAGSPREYPGAYRHVLTVAAARSDGDAIVDSTRGPQVAIAAPGKRVLSTLPNGRYGRRTGTSMAAAVVSGAAARLLAARPGLDASQLRALLLDHVRDVATTGRDDSTGWGMLDLRAALIAPTPRRDGAEPNDDPALARRTAELDPGAATGEVTVDASVEQWADPKDDYRVRLGVGDTLELNVHSLADHDLDLVIWRPDAPAFAPGSAYARRWLAAAALGPGTSEVLRHTATEAGIHTVEVQGTSGRGRYRLTVHRTAAPPVLPPVP
jgi:subtilisin family serine protease